MSEDNISQLHTRIHRLLDILSGIIGVNIGIELAHLGKFEVFKLLNVVGISFDILGVLVLSYVLVSNEKVKIFVAGWGTAIATSIVGYWPIGVFLGTAIASIIGDLSGTSPLFRYFVPITLFSFASVCFLEQTALFPIWKRLQNTDMRTKILGGYFLLSGLLIQLYAAVLDLYTI